MDGIKRIKWNNNLLLVYRWGILFLNFFSVVAISVFIYVTTIQILGYYHAREFLDSVAALPKDSLADVGVCATLMVMLSTTFVLREYVFRNKNKIIIGTLAFDFLLCMFIMYTLNFNYNGIVLYVFVNLLNYVRNGRGRFLFMAFAILLYLLTDYDFMRLYLRLYSIVDYISYYSSSSQQYFYSIYNIIISFNIILFLGYCICVIYVQRGTIEEVNSLYKELQTANEQLQEYAMMTEKMTQTKERNRLAREIHDTIGHTLTGISVGLDACIAIVKEDPVQTKKQLEIISDVARVGINDIRRSVNELRPDALERLSLDVAIRKMVSDMNCMSDTKIHFICELSQMNFDADEENAIYRVIQESITNSLRHGRAETIHIKMSRLENDLILTIRDNGIGCKEMKHGFGIKHIIERIHMLKGTVSFDGSDGFVVEAKLPIRWRKDA